MAWMAGPQRPRLDALLPPEMARRAEEIGVKKVSMDALGQFALAVLAGAFIAIGGVFATTALAGGGAAPWGPVRVLAGVAFSLGLILVIVGGAELFTGNNLIAMAWASGRVKTRACSDWTIVFAGNSSGPRRRRPGLLGEPSASEGAFGISALAIAHASSSSASDRRWRSGSSAMRWSVSRYGSATARGPPPTGSWPSSRR
jgi:hypothetical protein